MIKNGKVMPIDVVRYRPGLAFGSATRTTAGAATNDALPARVPRTMSSPYDIPPKTASNTPITPFIRGIAIARKMSLKPIDLKAAKCFAAIIPISMRKSVSTPGTKSMKNESVGVKEMDIDRFLSFENKNLNSGLSLSNMEILHLANPVCYGSIVILQKNRNIMLIGCQVQIQNTRVS